MGPRVRGEERKRDGGGGSEGGGREEGEEVNEAKKEVRHGLHTSLLWSVYPFPFPNPPSGLA